jgi:hypothetical protein
MFFIQTKYTNGLLVPITEGIKIVWPENLTGSRAYAKIVTGPTELGCYDPSTAKKVMQEIRNAIMRGLHLYYMPHNEEIT